MSPTFSIVPDDRPRSAKPETVAERIRRLQAEARGLAKDHVRAMHAHVSEGLIMAQEVVEGGDAYPPGVRAVAEKIVRDGESLLLVLDAVIARAKP